jgi:hypothetical protein
VKKKKKDDKEAEAQSRYLSQSIHIVRKHISDYDRRSHKTYPFLNRDGEINYSAVDSGPYDGLVYKPTAQAMATVHRSLMDRALRPEHLWRELTKKVNKVNNLHRDSYHIPPKWNGKHGVVDLHEVFLLFIPSSGRHHLTYVTNLYAKKPGIVPVLVVKPCEFNEYVQHLGKHFCVVELPTNNGHRLGAWILNLARSMRLKFMTMSDDNILYLKRVSRANDCEYSTTALRILNDGKAQINSAKDDVATLSLPLAAYDRTRFSSEFYVGWATSFVMYNVPLLNSDKYRDLNFDPRLQMFEDILFSHRCSTAGLLVVRFGRYR